MAFDDAFPMAEAAIRQLAGKTITYRRGELACDWPCVIGSTTFEVSTEFGLETFESRDFIGPAAELLLADGTEGTEEAKPATPQVGDRIWEYCGLYQNVYEVCSPPNQPCYKFSDPQQTTLRIHTKLIGEA